MTSTSRITTTLLLVLIVTSWAQNPTITAVQDNQRAETFGPFYCQVQLDMINNTGERIVIDYTITPGTASYPADYSIPATLRTYINIGMQNGSLGPITPVVDGLWEGDETATMTITAAFLENSLTPITRNDNVGIATIQDSDTPPVVIQVQDVATPEDNTQMWFGVRLDKANNSGERIVLVFTMTPGTASDPQDYSTPIPPHLRYIQTNSDMGSVGPANVVEDNLVESDETFTVTLTRAYTENTGRDLVINDNSGTGTIVNDDFTADVEVSAKWVRDGVTPGDLLSQVMAGGYYRWVLVVRNLGAADAEGVVITDPLPPGLTFVSASTSGNGAGYWSTNYNSGTRTVTFTASYLPVGAGSNSWLQVFCTVNNLPEGTVLTNQGCVTAATHPDPNSNNNCASATVTVVRPAVALCTDINSNRNVGQPPVLVTFEYLRPLTSYKWWLDLDKRSDWDKPRYIYQHVIPPAGASKNYEISMKGPVVLDQAADFIRVYDAGGYGRLQLVSGTRTTSKCPWENAVDGDVYWYDGTTEAAADESGAAWAIFEFIDNSTRKINTIRLLTDTGFDNAQKQASGFEVHVSTDGVEYTRVLSGSKPYHVPTPCDFFDDWMSWSIDPVDTKFIKLVITEPLKWTYVALGEFEVWFDTKLADADSSDLAVSGDEVTLTVRDADGNPITGLTHHDIVVYSYNTTGYYGDPHVALGTLTGEDGTTPGVYKATVANQGTVMASVNGVLIPKPVSPLDAAQPVAEPVSEKIEAVQELPEEFALLQNYPNPFNPETTISYDLPEGADVLIRIFDANGREVANLVNQFQAAGYYSITWRAGDLPSGVYFCQMTAGAFKSIKRMMLLR